MWQLKANGEFQLHQSDETSILIDPAATQPEQIMAVSKLDAETRVRIQFHSHADGRGFSLAKSLSNSCVEKDDRPKLIATGHLIPDQARLAFQSGFDAIEIEDSSVMRHGEDAWRQALEKSVSTLYFQSDSKSKLVYKYE